MIYRRPPITYFQYILKRRYQLAGGIPLGSYTVSGNINSISKIEYEYQALGSYSLAGTINSISKIEEEYKALGSYSVSGTINSISVLENESEALGI